MELLTQAARLAEPWASFYGDTPWMQTATTFLHLAGVVVGGGIALATDWGTLRTPADTGERARQLAQIRAAHVPVLAGLALAFTSGLLMLAADLETMAPSPVFWVKMALIALLLANGYVLARGEAALRAAPDAPAGWTRLRSAAIRSVTLWLAALLLGTMLMTIA